MVHRIRLALLVCLFACDSAETLPLVIPTQADIADEFVLELIQKHARAARAKPNDADLRGTLGLVYEANDQWSWAAQSFANAAELDPANPRWDYHAAVANFRSGNSALGDQLIASVAERFPSFAPGRFRNGVSLMDLGEVEAALAEFRACTELRPEFVEGRVSMAEALVLLDRSEEALKHVTAVLKLAPDFGRAQYVRGLALQGMGRLDEAEQGLALGAGSSRRLMPDNLVERTAQYAMGIQSMLSRSLTLLNSGRFSDARELVEQALERQPDDISLLNAQGMVYRRLKQPKRSIEILSRARELRPDHLGTLTILSSAHFDTQDYPRSLEAAEAAALISPEGGVVHFLRGRALLAMGRMPEAGLALRLSIQIDPSRTKAYLYLAESLSAQARYDEAEPIWKQAVERDPDNLPALFNLGMTQISLLKVDDARRTLEVLSGFDLSEPRSKDLEQKLIAAISKLTGE